VVAQLKLEVKRFLELKWSTGTRATTVGKTKTTSGKRQHARTDSKTRPFRRAKKGIVPPAAHAIQESRGLSLSGQNANGGGGVECGEPASSSKTVTT